MKIDEIIKSKSVVQALKENRLEIEYHDLRWFTVSGNGNFTLFKSKPVLNTNGDWFCSIADEFNLVLLQNIRAVYDIDVSDTLCKVLKDETGDHYLLIPQPNETIFIDSELLPLPEVEEQGFDLRPAPSNSDVKPKTPRVKKEIEAVPKEIEAEPDGKMTPDQFAINSDLLKIVNNSEIRQAIFNNNFKWLAMCGNGDLYLFSVKPELSANENPNLTTWENTSKKDYHFVGCHLTLHKKISPENTLCHVETVNHRKVVLIPYDVKYTLETEVAPARPMGNTDYVRLEEVLRLAYLQASEGKGKERHANSLPFHQQRMQTISQMINSPHGMTYQAIKKIAEGMQMPDKSRRVHELLGAIVYISGIIIYEQDNDQ